MLRNIDLNEISDGNLYTSNDLVRADCGGCRGCSDCCQGMGDSIILDPYDMDQLYRGTGLKPEELLLRAADLSVVDGIILPHLKMTGERDCRFCPGRADAGFMHSVPASAGSFLLEDCMRMVLFPTFFRRKSVKRLTVPKSGSKSGLTSRICLAMKTMCATGTTF